MIFTFNIVVDFSPSAQAFLRTMMSILSDEIKAATASADAAITRVQAEVSALTAQIASLTAQVADGGATPEDHADLVALQAKLDALNPANPAIL